MRLRLLIGALAAAASFSVTAAIPASEQATAVEFYHAGFDHYFITAAPAEISDLDTGVHTGWARTGYRFSVIKAGSTYPGTSPVCRFFSEKLSSHFYSAKPAECDDVKVKFSATWLFEAAEVYRAFLVDPATGVCPADTTPVYRLYNNRADANHRYTDQLSVFVFMKGKGYIPEGDGSPSLPVAFCTPSGGDAVPPASASAPKCTASASNATPAPGSTITLNAICTNLPTAYLWTGCLSTLGTCTASQSTAGQATYTLYAANAQGPADPASVTVTWTTPGGGNPPPPGGGSPTPPQCALSASPRFPAVGTSAVLSATCTQSPTSYQWLACDPNNSNSCAPIAACNASSATCMVSSSTAGNTRYIVSGINGVGTGPFVAIDVEWQNSAAFGGFCGQYERIKKVVIPYGDSTRFTTDVYGGFTGETVFIFQVTVPGSPSSYATAGYTSLAEYRGPPAYRHMTLSKQPCDFRNPDPTGVNGPLGATSGTAVIIDWNVGALPIGLMPGQTYYFSVRNLGCGQDSCDASTSINWPH
jgi:hypothetical protein